MNDVKFSILIPSYGKAEFLRKTLKSILSESYTNFEIIICTQGDFLLDKDLLIDSRIRNIHLLKPSRYLSRIELFKNATGDYVWFVDDDDEIIKGSLQAAFDLIKLSSADCLIFEKVDVYKDHSLSSDKIPSEFDNYFINYPKEQAIDDLLRTNKYNSVCTKIFKRKIEPNWIDIDIHQSEDKLLNYALYNACKSFLKCNRPIYQYFLYHGNWSQPITIGRLNDSISSRKALIELEPNYFNVLFKDIFDRIEQYLLYTDSIDDDCDILFNINDYNKNDVKKFLSSNKKLEYRLIANKKYKFLRMKGKIKRSIRKKKIEIEKVIKNDRSQRRKWLLLLLPLFCFSVISPIALLSLTTKVQDVANEITKCTKKDGFNLATFLPKDSSSGVRPLFSAEYYNLYDQFNTYSRCVETYDSLKTKQLRINSYLGIDGKYNDIETTLSNNLTFLTSPGIQIEKTTENNSIVYRNFIYKFQFKYEGLKKGDVHKTDYAVFCALHQQQADELIELINKTGKEKITEETLIGKYIKISSYDNSEQFVLRIFNIIKDSADYIHEYDEALGNFIFVNNNTFGQLELCNSYMMTKNSYENYYNLKTRSSMYKNINYKINYGNNQKKSSQFENIQKKLDDIMMDKQNNTTLIITLVSINFVILILFFVLLHNRRIEKNMLFLGSAMFIPLFPYLFIKLICILAKSISAFTYITSLLYFGFVVTYEVFIVFEILKLHYENKKTIQ